MDDGSHQMKHINAMFQFLDPMLPKNGVYMVEDLHAAYWEEYGGGRADSFVNQATNSIDSLNADHSRGVITAGFITRGTFSICFYDSIVALRRVTCGGKKHHRPDEMDSTEK